MDDIGYATRVMYNARDLIGTVAPRLRALIGAVGRPVDLTVSQAAHWFAFATDFRPDVIIELGRDEGNSTAAFTEVANQLGNTVVKSFCKTRGWPKKDAVAAVVGGESWFKPLELYTADITQVDFLPHVRDARRVLLLWDAHGFGVSDAVLGRLLPMLAEKEHWVICHDISDNRVCDLERSYSGRPSWRGMGDYYDHMGAPEERARVNLFWVNTIVDQAIPILDFCWRNRIEFRSADYDYHQAAVSHPDVTRAIRETWPRDLFQECNHWAYFSLNESRGEKYFPTPATKPAWKPQGDITGELESVYNSLSWKVTAPLRRLGRLLGMP